MPTAQMPIEEVEKQIEELLNTAKSQLKENFEDWFQEKFQKVHGGKQIERRTLLYKFQETVKVAAEGIAYSKVRNGREFYSKAPKHFESYTSYGKPEEALRVIVSIEGGHVIEKEEEMEIRLPLLMIYCILRGKQKEAIITYANGKPESVFEFKNQKVDNDAEQITVHCRNAQN